MNSADELPKEERIQLAIAAYRESFNDWEAGPKAFEDKPSVRKIARKHGIIHSTLTRRLAETKTHKEAALLQQRLLPEEESALVDWTIQMEAWGWPPRVTQLRFMALEMLIKRDDRNDLGINWVSKFLSRHKELDTVFCQALDKERALMHNAEMLNQWFQLYAKNFNQYKFNEEDCYNMDEKGFAMGLVGKLRVICSKHDRPALLTQCGNREWVSLIECVSADGAVLKPWVIFKGKQQQKAWRSFIKEGGHIALSENGWTNNEIGLDWLKQCFEPETRSRLKGRYRLLILDGHASHLTSEAIQFCKEKDIILLCLPSHSTDMLQPLDVGVFHPLSTAYRVELEKYTRLGVGYSIDKADFLLLYQKARNRALSTQNIQHAWSKSGLFPFNPAIVLQKLPSPPHPSTPPKMTVTSSNDVSVSVAFTPANADQVNTLMEQLTDNDSNQLILDKLGKACKSALASSHLLRITNEELLVAARRKHERANRAKGHYGTARIMNSEVLEEREQKLASKEKEKIDKQMTKEFNLLVKSFNKLSPDLFMESKQRSPIKKALQRPPMLPPPSGSIILLSPSPIKKRSRGNSLPKKTFMIGPEANRMKEMRISRSGRTIKPSQRLD